jgi:sugar O-acyltransferase (sialic acid O-acetyltransferase NeuD family)
MGSELIFVIGAGGHGLVVIDAMLMSGFDRKHIRVIDEDTARIGGSALGITVQALEEDARLAGHRYHVSIGNNAFRDRVFAKMSERGAVPYTVRHLNAIISPAAGVEDGAFIAAGAIVAPLSKIGRGAIVNHAAVVDHECHIGSFCHVAPGATLSGNVHLGARVLVGAGANILPGVSVGDDAIIGAGAVVDNNVPPGTTYAGVPARRLR